MPAAHGPEKPKRRAAGILKLAASRKLRRDAYHLLDHGTNNPLGQVLHKSIIALILVSVATSVLESVPSLETRYARLFFLVEFVAVVVFTVEYLARVWVSPEHPPFRELSAARARLKFVTSGDAIVDLLAVLPFYLALLGLIDIRVLLVLRLLRFLKLTRYSPGMRSLVDAIQSEKIALLSCLMFLVGLALIAASLMHWAEQDAQPDKFGTVPDALYWAMITLTTVGYGDVTPITPLGKVIASVSALLGLVMLALPVGILATSFAQVIQRRDFVVTWSMVARVPLFNELTAAEIVEIMRYLHSQSVEAGEVVVRRGDVAHSMYFIAMGEVTIDLPGKEIRLGEGHFFGEIALLKQAKRTATVRSVTKTKLLVLDATDMRSLMERKPHIGEVIERIARERMDAERLTKTGDLVAEEIAEGEGQPARD